MTANGRNVNDVFVIGSAEEGIGDEIFGGDGGVDNDSLEIAGVQGVDWRLADLVTDSDGNGFDGTIEFLDSSGGTPVEVSAIPSQKRKSASQLPANTTPSAHPA